MRPQRGIRPVSVVRLVITLLMSAAAALALAAFIGRAGAATPGAAAVMPTATVTGEVTVNGSPYSGGKLPFGSLVDLVHGTITMKTAVGTLRASGVGRITAAFVLLFTHVDGEPYVELRLAEGNFSVCRRRTTSGTSSASTKVIRALWGNGIGNFQTRGRFAAATVRGTYLPTTAATEPGPMSSRDWWT